MYSSANASPENATPNDLRTMLWAPSAPITYSAERVVSEPDSCTCAVTAYSPAVARRAPRRQSGLRSPPPDDTLLTSERAIYAQPVMLRLVQKLTGTGESSALSSLPVTNRDQRPGVPNRGQWYEQTPVVVAAGVAGVLAVILIVFAVLQTSRHSSAPAGTSFTSSSTTTTTSSGVRRLSTTTSTFTPTGSSSATLFPPDTPSPGSPGATTEPDDTTTTSTGTTTMSNMFATTRTTR